MKYVAMLLIAASLCGTARSETPPPVAANCYVPIEGGWCLRLSNASTAETGSPSSEIGAVQDNARLHRRPLYPPADRSLIWNEAELQTLQRYGFRPLVLAYVEPRFLFDFHSAGGLLGHLRLGLVKEDTAKWFHEWSDLEVRYVDGRMDYLIHDPAFPGVSVALSAVPLAASAGLVLRIGVTGGDDCELVWTFGGASAFFTNWAMTAPEFSF